MEWKKAFTLSALFCLLNILHAQKTPATLVLDGSILLQNRKASSKDASKKAAIQSLVNNAEKILQGGQFYSVMHKNKIPPSGNKHDYMSIGPYWWPDPNKPNGLPYIRRDGERNPEYYEISDTEEMDKLESESEALALAYFFSKDERFAQHAARLIRTWFIDPETRQNPNLNFGQGIPGINTGRGIGIIETRELYRVIDAAILLQGSKHWSKQDHLALKKWFGEYLSWLVESPIGRDEADEHNNHGTYYDVQVIAFALFVNQPERARQQIEVSKQRIASQIKADGSQPHELARTLSWGYTTMNLWGFFTLARLSETLQVDLWNYTTADGKGIHKALDWLLPYLKNEREWTYQQIKKREFGATFNILKVAAKKYQNLKYAELAKQLESPGEESNWEKLTF